MLFEQIGFVIGNHPSRLKIDLNKLSEHGLIYGCNALYRDYKPKELFVIDHEMYDEVKRSYRGRIRYCNRGIPNFSTPPSEIFCCSGIAAVWGMITLETVNTIYLVGWSPWNTVKRENVYDGTTCYPDGTEKFSEGVAIWVKQFIKLFGKTKIELIFVCDMLPKELDICDNISHITMDELQQEFN